MTTNNEFEWRRKMSASMRKFWDTDPRAPILRKKLSKSMTKFWIDIKRGNKLSKFKKGVKSGKSRY